ncbi:MAG: hypothetical protein M1814_005888 [Vezdaea aestivalis]|nr:MAG: hypothetical protein M1814_005888 [Vezdaea aestivalis]
MASLTHSTQGSMVSSSNTNLLKEIDSPSSETQLKAALKTLKNILIGHEQNKEQWVAMGILPVLGNILKNTQSEPHGKETPLRQDIRLGALVIIESIARCRSAVHDQMLADNVIEPILYALDPTLSPQSYTTSALRALHAIASTFDTAQQTSRGFYSILFDKLFSPPHVKSLTDIIGQSSSSIQVQSQINYATSIITKACQDERHQSSLASGGVLNSLSLKVAEYIVAKGYVIQRPDIEASQLPKPAPVSASLGTILEAIATIIKGSKIRCAHFLHSPAINAVLSWDLHVQLSQQSGKSQASVAKNLYTTPSPNLHNPIEGLLPEVRYSPSRLSATQIPLYAIQATSGQVASSPFRAFGNRSSGRLTNLEESSGTTESPLIAFLCRLTREQDSLVRLHAASVVIMLYRNGFTRVDREIMFSSTIVPQLVQLLDEFLHGNEKSYSFSELPTEIEMKERLIREKVPYLLGLLLVDSPILQKAAVDAQIVKKICILFKKTFETVPQGAPAPAWKSSANRPRSESSTQPSLESRLGKLGNSAFLKHRMKVRAAALKAIASLAANSEDYRKAIVDQGVTALISASLLSATPPREDSSFRLKNSEEWDPNPETVLTAASEAIKALGRSINVLRTQLIDIGVAKPLFKLMSHDNDDVKVHATAAICNLVLEFSPTREPIVEGGALTTLCHHAHSLNPRLRLNALWALKNVVYLAQNSVRKLCLDGLGGEWLIELLESENAASFSLSTNEGEASTGEQISPEPQATDMMDFETGKDLFHDDRDEVMNIADSVGVFNYDAKDTLNGQTDDSGLGKWVRNGDVQIRAWKASEEEQLRNAILDDTLIQEQAINLLRNSLCPPGTNEMIDVVFSKYGTQRLFSVLTQKLRRIHIDQSAKGKQPSHSHTDRGIVQPKEEIVLAVIATLVHIATGNSRQRQTLLSQTELFRLLLPFLDHYNKEIRISLIWIVINLTWVDNEADRPSARQRAVELRKFGFQAKLEKMEGDPDVDLRERIKTALFQLGVAVRE